jgi:hypothetical protein
MLGIPKGSVLKEVAPYAVVPLYYDSTPSDGATNVTNCRIDVDPTRVPNLQDLPKWNMCQIWDQNRSNWIFETSQMKKFLRRARRMASSSSSDNVVASWHILCILTILRIVADNVSDEERTNELVSTIQQMSKNDSPSQWWSTLVSEHYDDNKERKIIPKDDDYEDDNCSLLVELWPLIRKHIPWMACQRLYRRIQNRLHILTIPHPLTTWAQKTIFELTNNEFETSWKIFQNEDTFQQKGKSLQTLLESTDSSSSPNRLHASKLWLDRVANIPERLVGVLIDDPLKILLEGDEPTSVSTSSKSKKSSDISTALTLPRCHQSCLPNTCLVLHAIPDIEKTPHVVVPAIEKGKNSRKICCRWIALYDLSSAESENENRTLSTMPKSHECNCFQCTYENKPMVQTFDDNKKITAGKTLSLIINSANLAQARRLAHSYFFKEAFGDAMLLYQTCHQYCASSSAEYTVTDTNSTKSKVNAERKAHAEADLWHTMGAVILTQQKFARAQQHWENGSRYQSIHNELSEQLEKQRAYQYFHPLPEPLIAQFSYETIRASKQHILRNPTKSTNQSIFVTPNVIEVATCRNLIKWAQEYASNNGGWTASRHYAVPTTDLPIHKVPKLLEWFQEWMPEVLLPLLRDQFGTARCDNSDERFYVHDAFLVRYEATASSCFLPLHYDESTHSCVLALNDDFDGGGSYVYDLNRSIAPATGGMASFLGNRCLHGGNPVTRGVRYILAIFLFRDRDLSHDPPEETDKSVPFPPIETNGNKRRDEMRYEDDGNSKRSKKDDGLQSDKGGGFSFSFF